MEKVLLYTHKNLQKYRDIIEGEDLGLSISYAQNPQEIEENIEDAKILFISDKFPYDLLSKAKNLQWIQLMSAGVENFISSLDRIPDTLLNRIQVTRVKGPFGDKIAEYIVAYMLAFMQDIPRALRQKEKNQWDYYDPQWLMGKTAGIAGVGAIGQVVAKRLKAFNMNLFGLDLFPKEIPEMEKVYGLDEMDTFLPSLDFLILTMPLTSQTEGMFNKDVFKKMKKSAILVNTARGPLVVEEDLLVALKEKWIQGAIIDVFKEEPLPTHHPFWDMDNLLLTPHNSGPSLPEDVYEVFKRNLELFREREPLFALVDVKRGF